jgi:KaiC/GvpD/RAD55 family RecA-like ATPase
MRLYTKISEAHWCESDGQFKSANLPSMRIWENGPDEVYWLDKLFEGGIFIPKDLPGKNRALTILLTGPPGTGKSTLAMELCHNLTATYVIEDQPDEDNNKKMIGPEIKGFSSIYITSESNEIWAEQKIESFRWENNFRTKKKKIEPIDDPKDDDLKDENIVKIWQTKEFTDYLQEEEKLTGITPTLIDALSSIFGNTIQLTPLAEAIRSKWTQFLNEKRIKKHNPNILAIDSLNTFEPSKRPEIFKRFMSLVDSGPMIIILVVESGSEKHSSEFWEYTSDIVIRLDKHNKSDYLVRTIEILKARYQSHIWGEHQLKLYTPSLFEKIPQITKNMTERDKENLKDQRRNIIDKKKRAHPYHESGGVFIFPSIHYYLSVYKRMSPISQSTYYEPPLETLKETFTEGFPRGRCIGFIGIRGGHKSHLGYLTLLKKITESVNERALVVSLRDDEGMAKKTIRKILQNETKSNDELDDLIEQDRIEIMYSPPGFITPEEFFHKMLLSIQRLKNHSLDTNVTVLFNSLDQLSSRFPLCASQQIFIPGIIAALSAEGVTSIFIAVDEPGQPPQQYGLLSMADALISFKRERYRKEDYLGHISDCKRMNIDKNNKEINEAIEKIPEIQQIVSMRIIRFAGGQAAGAGGMLELIHKNTENSGKSSLFHHVLSETTNCTFGNREGLVFVPFSRNYSQEECLLKMDIFENNVFCNRDGFGD